MQLALILVGCLVSVAPQDAPEFRRFPPVEAKDVAKTFRVQNGFKLDLVASEPLVMDPVAAAFDENGRLYVVEMSDYPHVDAKNDKPFAENLDDPPVGRVRILIDKNDDGIFDESKIFADKLSWPTGIAVFKGGVYVAATPDIVYLKDTDGDLKADLREKVFTGFRKFNVQAVMNNLQWSLEHKIIGAGSSNGGSVKREGDPAAKPVNVLRRDFRFDPNTKEIEVVSGGARFGNAVDDWGNRFLCDIRNPAEHVVLPLKYLDRNPFLPLTKVLHDTAVHGDAVPVFRISPPEPWREFRAKRWSSIGKTLPRSELVGAGFLTSSSGLTFYRGDAYPEGFRGNLFLGEVANNLIFRMKVEADGVTFKAERADPGVEFIASTDTWFRPVNFVNAPDGTLYLLDMYRETIEHPWSIPDDIRARLDLRSGEDRGRVYRITPPAFRRRSTPRLGDASSAELVKLLAHSNAWHRDTAHRLLFERQDQTAVPLLHALLKESRDPLARLHALWSLEGLKALSNEEIAAAFADRDAGIREHAIRLAESRLPGPAMIRAGLASLGFDPSKRVLYQLALTAGEHDDIVAVAWLRDVAEHSGGDPFIAKAILSSSKNRTWLLYKELRERSRLDRGDFRELLVELASMIGASGDIDGINRVLTFDPGNDPSELDRASALGLARGLRKGGASLITLRTKLHSLAARRLDQVAKLEREAALNPETPADRRLSAVSFIGESGAEGMEDALIKLFETGETSQLRVAALQALSSRPGSNVVGLVLKDWKSHPPAIRAAAVDALLAHRDRIMPLLEAIDSGIVPASQIPTARRALLRNDRDLKIKTLALKVFAESPIGPRASVIGSYKPAIEKSGDEVKGRVVFDRECASCHKLGERGFAVGPNLVGVARRTPDELLIHILDPNREVAPDFVEYVAALKDGRTVTGIVTGETSSGVSLRRAGGIEESFLKSQVDELKGTGKSLMPEGLEKNVKPDEMTDLITFLLNLQRQ